MRVAVADDDPLTVAAIVADWEISDNYLNLSVDKALSGDIVNNNILHFTFDEKTVPGHQPRVIVLGEA